VTTPQQLLKDKLLLKEQLKERQATDPLRTWAPTPKQGPFIHAVLKGKPYENWFVAANRSGKSDAGAYCGATLARFGVENPRGAYSDGGRVAVFDRATSGWVVSLDFPSSRDIIQPKYFDNGFVPPGASHAPFIPPREIDDWRASDQILKLKNGSLIGFKSCDSGPLKFQGAEKDFIHFDEEPRHDVYQESTIRVAAGRRLRVFGTCTLLPPEGQVGGVTWLFGEIITPFLDGKQRHWAVFGASIYDNPHLPPEEIKRLEAKYPEGSIERKIRLNGEWLPGLAGSRAYTAFQRRLHVRPQPAIVFRRPLCWTWDFNVEPMVSYVGQRELKLFRVMQEFVLEEGNVPRMVDLFREHYPTHGAEIWIYGDATGKSRTGQTGQSDYQIILNAMRAYPVPVRLKVPEANPFVPDRINAVNMALQDENGEIRVEIDPSCDELVADFEQTLRDPKGGLKKTSNRRDPYYRRTHMTDAVGYWIAFEEPVKSATAATYSRRTVRPRTPGYSFGA
jgi:phage terminase large subunit-like protein